MQLTDQAFRSQRPPRAADQLIHILDVQGVPRFFSPLDRTLLEGLPVVRRVSAGRGDAAGEGEDAPGDGQRHPARRAGAAWPSICAARRDEGVRMNVNYLGEALLGEEDAQRRLHGVSRRAAAAGDRSHLGEDLDDLLADFGARPRAHDRSALRPAGAALPRGRQGPLHAPRRHASCRSSSISTWRSTATRSSRPTSSCERSTGRGSNKSRAGIALQAYIPDSFATQQRINEWARHRVAAGGAPVTIRVVKGANMEMERVEASLRGWPQAPYKTKLETDANYLRMLTEGMRPENLAAVRLGIASHNLFSLAYGLVLAAKRKALRPRAVRNARRHGEPPAARAVRADAATCCSTPRPAGRKSSPPRSATSSAGSTRTPAPTISCATPSASKSAATTWQKLEQQFIEAFEAMETRQRRTAPHAGPESESSRRPSRLAGSRPATLASTLSATNPTPTGRSPQNGEWATVDHRQLAAAPWRRKPPTCRS